MELATTKAIKALGQAKVKVLYQRPQF